MTSSLPKPLLPLKGARVLSLCLNLPGPAALMRCRQMGASVAKLAPPAPEGLATSDPMSRYSLTAYEAMHAGVRVLTANLKTEQGQKVLHRELAKADVLLTSFRPSALRKLGLEWKALRRNYPTLSLVAIVGAPGARGEEPGHDLTYLAENHLVNDLALPPTLYADMGGSLMASEAVLKALLWRHKHGKGCYCEVALSEAAAYLALPRSWGLTTPGAVLGGAHAAYRVYPCKDGRVALAALEPHFAKALGAAAGLPDLEGAALLTAASHNRIADFLLGKTREALDQLAIEQDIPLLTLPP